MKSTVLYLILSLTTMVSFIGSYFLGITVENSQEYLALAIVILVDGFFGIWAGCIREGFKTYKAIRVIKTFIFWIIMLTTILAVEKSYVGVEWLSETILPPFLIFQLISILKNASMSGFIPKSILKNVLSSIDKHKD